MELKSVKGMNDVLPPEIHIWRRAEDVIRHHFESFGYSEIKTPVVEYTSLFARGVGDTTDIVEKEMYTFKDRNDESLSLRPEGTASVVRAYIESRIYNTDSQQKFYYIGPMFRYERPQKGRYRQFYQYGIELFGIENATVDAELIYMLVKLYEKFDLSGLEVKVNSVGCDQCRPVYREKLQVALLPQKDKLCADCQRRIERNPLRVLDCKNPSCKEIASKLPSIFDFLDEACRAHFASLQESLKALDVRHIVDKNLVRGLDYYNRTAFEISSSGLGSQNAVGGGGRYDSLVEQFGGPKTPAVGYAGGFERLVLLLQEKQVQFKPELEVFFVAPDEAGFKEALIIANLLRNVGIRAELDYTGKKMKNQMQRAEKLGARKVWIIGGSEIEKDLVVLRDMDAREQKELSGKLKIFKDLAAREESGKLRAELGLARGVRS